MSKQLGLGPGDQLVTHHVGQNRRHAPPPIHDGRAVSNSNSLEAAIEAAAKAKDRGELLWPRPLIEHFEDRKPALAMAFAITTIRQCSPSDQFAQWLASLSEFVGSPTLDDAKLCEQLAQDIWYFDSRVDFVQRAISRLYLAWSYFVSGEHTVYNLEAAKALSVFSHSPPESGHILDDRFEMAVNAARTISHELLD